MVVVVVAAWAGHVSEGPRGNVVAQPAASGGASSTCARDSRRLLTVLFGEERRLVPVGWWMVCWGLEVSGMVVFLFISV